MQSQTVLPRTRQNSSVSLGVENMDWPNVLAYICLRVVGNMVLEGGQQYLVCKEVGHGEAGWSSGWSNTSTSLY